MATGYTLLTGATGLLGAYLLRDLTRGGRRLAVLARRNRYLSAEHRIDMLVSHWEKSGDCALPRPVVLEGDLREDSLGLDADTLRWVSENCTAFLHNAASLTFHADGPNEEPWLSNLHGTRHVLEFCRRTGIREFHHVSTAYVCGLRQDCVYEHELDVGQEHGNDYEVSKFESEKLVRNADFLQSLTVYRPAIIVGDSQNGYTTTYHGFYVPLKLVASLISKTGGVGVPRDMIEMGVRMASQRLREMLNLTGAEAKNYVPVDWVSAVMAHIFLNPEHHGRTYHLAPRERVSIDLMRTAIEETVCRYVETTSTVSKNTYDWNEFERFFIEGMNVYRSYWRDDPTFDCTNTLAAAPHLPCPVLDADRIAMLCRYAIDNNFGWPKPTPMRPAFDVHAELGRLVGRVGNPAGEAAVRLGLQVNGSGGGQWELFVQEGRVVRARQGISPQCVAVYYLNTDTFRRLVSHESSVDQAIRAGRVLIEGNTLPPAELVGIFDRLIQQA